MKKIYFLKKHPIKIGDVIEHNGYKAIVTEKLIKFHPELFVVEDPMRELLDKAKRDYPVGTVFINKYGIQKVLSDEPFIGRVTAGIILINTDKFPGGGIIYTPEDGWAEILPLKFTTEDGVDIYGDMETYLVHSNDSDDICFSHGIWDGNSMFKSYKYFYHKENALAYIEKHKEKTLEDYENTLLRTNVDSINAREVCWFYHILKKKEPKLYYTKILQLIADHLNDGWKPNFSDDKSKWYIREDNTDWTVQRNRGTVLFKTKKLAEKARLILGDKVKYLFKQHYEDR